MYNLLQEKKDETCSKEQAYDNSINMNLKLPRSETPWWKKELQRAVEPPRRMKTTMGTRDNSRWRKECYERIYDQRITIYHGEWCIRYDSILHMDLQEQVYKARFVICLKKNRLWHDILYWPKPLEVYVKHRTTCTRWYSTSGGVTTKDLWVWHGMTRWTTSW